MPAMAPSPRKLLEDAPAAPATLPKNLPGINVEEGLRYLGGNDKSYRNLLKRENLNQ